MVTRKSNKPAGRGVKDDEVKTLYHDEVLLWLIENLSNVVADVFGMNDQEEQASFAKALSLGKQWVSGEFLELLKKFADGTKDPAQSYMEALREEPNKLSEETRDMLAQAVGRFEAVKRKIGAAERREGFGAAEVNSYEVMKPVYRIEHHATDTKSHEAGFIDVEALIFKPREFEIRIKGIEREYGNQKHITHLGNESEFQELAQAFVPANVSVVAKGVTTTVWMSVRTGSFTLGEILQELKALRQLGEKTQAVALVVDGLDEKVRVHIEREGFFVIDKSEYGAIGTEC